jgi:hypothetical protein
MDIVEAAKKITESRNDLRGSIKDRSDKYIASGLIIKMERFDLVLNRILQGITLKKQDIESIDTMIDLMAYLIELGDRIL